MSAIRPEDEKIARDDPLHNSLEARSLRVIEEEIRRLEGRLARLRFAAETMARHVPTGA